MAKKIIFIILFSVCLGDQAYANIGDARTLNLSADLAGIPVGAYAIRFQYSPLSYLALTVPFNLTFKEASLISQTSINILRVFGYGIFPDVRVSTGVGVMLNYQGWYFEPMLEFGYAKMVYPFFEQSMFLLAPTFKIGYQNIFESGFMINVGIGISGLFYFPTIVGTNAWIPVTTLAIGYAF